MQLRKDIIEQIQSILSTAQGRAIRSVDSERVLMYWQIGRVIFEEEQGGKERAEYGKFVIKSIADIFQPQLGSGFSVRQLERYKQFCRTFPIASALRTQLNWTHYKLMLSLENNDKRDFISKKPPKTTGRQGN
jgi:hypothetical protein